MDNKITITLRENTSSELVHFLEEQKRQGKSYPKVLEQLYEENKQLHKQVVTQNEWTGLRMALRATEKNSYLLLELMNNLFLHQPMPVVSSQERKSLNLATFETNWKDFIQGLQAARFSNSSQNLAGYAQSKEGHKDETVLPAIPDFDE